MENGPFIDGLPIKKNVIFHYVSLPEGIDDYLRLVQPLTSILALTSHGSKVGEISLGG